MDRFAGSHSRRHGLKEATCNLKIPSSTKWPSLPKPPVGLAQAAGEEAKSAFRSQSDRWAADLDLIRRDEFEAVKAEIAALRAEIAAAKGPAST